jgi:hexosaminidase
MSLRRLAWLCSSFGLCVLLEALAAAQHLAWDECDGRSCGGFAGEAEVAGAGGWERAVAPRDGTLVATVGNHWRALAAPVRHGVVWYAVTLRMQAPIEGYASVAPAAGPGHQVSELGFNSSLGTGEGVWTSSHGVVRTGLGATTTQTFLQRYDLDARRWSAWAAADDGRALLDGDGQVSAAPLVHDAALNTGVIGALYLTKGSAQLLAIHRLALARSAAEALTPVERAVDSNMAGTAPPSPAVPFALVPWPRRFVVGEGALVLSGEVTLEVTDPSFAEHADVLRKALCGLVGRLPSSAASAAEPFIVELRIDTTLPPEHCLLYVGDRVVLTGADTEAVARASATLLQLMQRDGDVWQVPRVMVSDAPSCTYRGLLVDVARHPHPIAVLEELVTLCWFYKVRYLQLHLTDDQAFTFPSTAFPLLATPGHSYTLAELRGLHDFAAARGVTLIPELDVPGHSGAAIAAMPELFKASDRHHATINFVRTDVLAAVDTLIGELVDVFPSSPFVHVGGDECDLEHVMQEADFRVAAAREGVTDAHELYRLFLCQLREMVHKRGKRMLVWEGFGPDGQVAIPTDVTVMAFEMLYHTPDKLVAAGYPVINTSWRPLYVVNDRCWDEREIYAWDRGQFRHFVEGFPAFDGMEVPRDKVLGAQMCAWEQSAERELPSLRRRLPALAERVWNEDAARSADEFLARLAATDERLSALLTGRK